MFAEPVTDIARIFLAGIVFIGILLMVYSRRMNG